ncbi:MAG: hypothetical protein WCX46_02380 [Candidatus Paceibacterota bacterium]
MKEDIYLVIKMYPTKEEILKEPQPPIEKELTIIKKWKKLFYKNWNNKKETKKENQIISLLKTICNNYEIKNPKVKFDKKTQSCYNVQSKTIILQNTSIITALHELSHHLFGSSELKACRYSIWIFKLAFPKSFEKLNFKGHLLTK